MATQYKIRFTLKGSSTNHETIVSANNTTEAKKLLEAQYSSQLNNIMGVTEIKK